MCSSRWSSIVTPKHGSTDAIPKCRNSTIAWTLNSLVIGAIEGLQTLGINVVADVSFDSWVIMAIWYVSLLDLLE